MDRSVKIYYQEMILLFRIINIILFLGQNIDKVYYLTWEQYYNARRGISPPCVIFYFYYEAISLFCVVHAENYFTDKISGKLFIAKMFK